MADQQEQKAQFRDLTEEEVLPWREGQVGRLFHQWLTEEGRLLEAEVCQLAASNHPHDAAVLAGARRGIGIVQDALFPAKPTDETAPEVEAEDPAMRWSKKRRLG